MIIPIFKSDINIIDISITLFAAFYPGIMVFFILPLGSLPDLYGKKLLVLAFFVTWATDTFAYVFGVKLGKRKLCPSVSPNKTIEGSLGGLIGSIVIGVLFGLFINHFSELSIDLYHFIVIGLLGGVVSQLGDLCASSIKRFCQVKDFGKLLPGHGGLLDRFDSLLFTMPTIYLYCLIFFS
ncbi:MAG TPA: CDP-archaeol synthase, partial [Clostridia bacterium]|nr:CDP-archaeol synthase [Clostridia bacterium]